MGCLEHNATGSNGCRKNNVNILPNEFRGERRQCVRFTFGIAVLDHYVFALDVAQIPQPLAK